MFTITITWHLLIYLGVMLYFAHHITNGLSRLHEYDDDCEWPILLICAILITLIYGGIAWW